MPVTVSPALINALQQDAPKPSPDMDWQTRLFAADPRLSQAAPGNPGFEQFKNMLVEHKSRDVEAALEASGLGWILRHLPLNPMQPMPPQKFDGWFDLGPSQSPDATRGRTITPNDLADTMRGRLEGRRERGGS